ncbi:MAG TPA: hypothetical protein VHT71_11965 [Methylomirabilota bacterium]|jgi:hypothetical protein|nr:hypothetical protein [Methylomirabilota bacterium]
MILCDLDNVLATNRGRDTAVGQPIHRTFVRLPPALLDIRQARVPIHVVTKKTEAEAAQILAAIGLTAWVDSVIGANRLLWATLLDGVRRRRAPSTVSKVFCTRFLSAHRTGAVVMIEDRPGHLREMLDHGSIDAGILVPPIRFNGDDVVEWFDVNAALLTALMIVGTTAVPLRSGEDGFAEDRGIIRLPSQRPGIDGVPAVKSDQLATGQVLRNAGFSPVSLLRHARQRLHPRHS